MPHLSHYVYVNQQLVDEYASQLGIEDERSIAKITSKLSVSLTGPKIESNREYIYDELPLHKKLERLLEQLKKHDLMVSSRPIEMKSFYGGNNPRQLFGLESVTATKVTFTKSQIDQVPGIRELAVWIADPDPGDLSTEEWTFRGTFLLLPQANFDDAPFHSVYSGCSALQAVMNGYSGKSVIVGASGEPLGRGSYLHPVEKLKEMGGISTYPQSITVLYRMRYMTNEQCYVHNGKQHRVNDLLAYPLFICAN